MKKVFITSILALFTLTLVGCEDIVEEVDCEKYPYVVECLDEIDPDNPGDTTLINVLDALPDEEITISFWHVYGQEKGALLDAYIAEFEDLYPNITVDAESQGGYNELREKAGLAIQSGDTPTLLVGYPDHVAGYLEANAVIPLDDFVKHETWGVDLTDFIDSYIEENNQYPGGFLFSMPYSKSTEMVVINKTIFDAHEAELTAAGLELKWDEPYTWAELDLLADILVGDGADQCEYLINYDSPANFFINSVRQWDGGYTNSNGDILVNNANTLAMLQYVKERFEAKTMAIPLAWNQEYGSANFLLGDSCMTVGSTAGISYNVPDNNEFEIVVGPVPQYDMANHPSAVQQGPNIAIMEDTSDAERLAAWLLIKHITNPVNTAKWSMLTGYLPVRYSGYDSAVYQEFLGIPALENPAAYDFSDDLDDLLGYPADYIYEAMTANAAFLQIDYNDYDPAFAGRAPSAEARVQAEISMKAVFAGNATPQQAIDSMLAQLGVN